MEISRSCAGVSYRQDLCLVKVTRVHFRLPVIDNLHDQEYIRLEPWQWHGMISAQLVNVVNPSLSRGASAIDFRYYRWGLVIHMLAGGKIMYLIGMIFFVFFLLTALKMWERRMVWPYGKPDPTAKFKDAASYGARWVSDAIQEGFHYLGLASDLKGKMYRIKYAMLASPERDCIVIIGMGTLLGKKLEGTWIHSPVANGRSYYTTDNQAGVEIDITGSWKSQMVPSFSFAGLWKKHRAWIQSNALAPYFLRAGQELDDFRRMREDHFRKLRNSGLIEFTDGSFTYWRYTLIGALKSSIYNFFIGLCRTVSFGRFPRTA